MRLYKITLHTDTPKVAWAGTQADARAARIEFETPYKELKKADRPEVTVEEVDVPTAKAGLLEFLNGLNEA